MLLKMAKDNYDSMKAKKNVDDFLLGPLNWATQFETVLTTLGKDKQKSQIEFRILISKKGTSETIDYKDPKQFPRVWKTREKPGNWKDFSDIEPESLFRGTTFLNRKKKKSLNGHLKYFAIIVTSIQKRESKVFFLYIFIWQRNCIKTSNKIFLLMGR